MVIEVNNYILITPCKDEEFFLPHLAESIMKQTVRPVLWLIVDDNSTDNTPKLISEYKSLHNWICTIRLNEGIRDVGIHFARVLKLGFETAFEICENENIDFEFMGLADADLIFNTTYFETIISEFKNNSNLGIAGGGLREIVDGNTKYIHGVEDEPSGGNMVIRKKCYLDCGGIQLSYSCDSVLKVQARLKGWEIKRFEDYSSIITRKTSTSEGHWKGYVQRGQSAYYRNLNIFHVIAIGIRYIFKSPYYLSIAYLYGYFNDLLQKKPQIENEEIKKYYWNKWKKCIR